MAFRFNGNFDELCYPFIYEQSWLCDFEVVTDELCALLGAAISHMDDSLDDLRADLERIQPLAFHVNGSIRGRLAVSEADLQWLAARLQHYREQVPERLHGFVLPRGLPPVPQLHMARSGCKKAIRLMVRLEQDGMQVPMLLPRLCNLLCNLLHVLTLVVNQRRGLIEPAFVSQSYGKPVGGEQPA